jgi:hypothetical protein
MLYQNAVQIASPFVLMRMVYANNSLFFASSASLR